MERVPSMTDQDLLTRLAARVNPGEVAPRVLAELRREPTAYQRLSDEASGLILEVIRGNMGLFLRWIGEAIAPQDEELLQFGESAHVRAMEGMPLEDLLHAYRVGAWMVWEALLEQADDDEHAVLLSLPGLMFRYLDIVSSAITRPYLDAREHLVSEDERRARNLADALARDALLGVDDRELAARIGFPLQDAYVPFAAVAPSGSAHDHARIAARLRARGALALTEGDRVSGLASQALTSADFEPGVLLALGVPTPRQELTAAREELRLLVDLGRRSARTGEIVAEEHLPELLLARSPRLARALRRRVLGALADKQDLLTTLTTLVACDFDRARTAAALHVHRNTLIYRLQRIETATGLRFAVPRDMTLVMLAVSAPAILERPDGRRD